MPRLITAIICLFLTLILGFFIIWPKYQDLRDLKLEIKTRETELNYREEYFSDLNKISEELKKYEAELSKINDALPDDPSLPSLLNFLEKASSQNGLVFKKLGSFSTVSLKKPTRTATPSEQQPLSPSEIKETRLGFEVSGSYSALKNFLSTLEKSARLIEIETISFSFEEGEIFSFALEIKTFSY
ncbi:type 4a pilus biogenesis protein PilO [Patescibacteria group bacterium]|nr:type 4a pilus biogenesis protein PilO [Patescibacteria group bacterium]